MYLNVKGFLELARMTYDDEFCFVSVEVMETAERRQRHSILGDTWRWNQICVAFWKRI